jgi:hypothetical protein
MNPRTRSDILFEAWLRQSGYRNFTYEPAGTSGGNPDFRVRLPSLEIVCEVKEFQATAIVRGMSTFDARSPIREKINAAASQFRNFKANPCVLVLANPHGAFLLLDQPRVIAEVMFGNFEFLVPIRIAPEAEPAPPVILQHGAHGKMRKGRSEEPQNTTISAIMYLRQPVEGRLGAIVYENPFARIPLPREHFSGLYDVRVGETGDGSWAPVSCGRALPGEELVGV